MHFIDREDAGKKLGKALKKFKDQDAVVYALPRGGIPVGVAIVTELQLPLDVVIARKIGHPQCPEYAIAAITENGEVASNPVEVSNVSEEWFNIQRQAEQREAIRRRQVYMEGRKATDPAGKIAILVDDGIATGLTTEAAILDLRKRNPAHLVLAAPVAPADTIRRLSRLVDECVVLDAPEFFQGAIGFYYSHFPQLSDEDVIALLDLVNPRAEVARLLTQ
jgi:predicted phosphoribosyltransferase